MNSGSSSKMPPSSNIVQCSMDISVPLELSVRRSTVSKNP